MSFCVVRAGGASEREEGDEGGMGRNLVSLVGGAEGSLEMGRKGRRGEEEREVRVNEYMLCSSVVMGHENRDQAATRGAKGTAYWNSFDCSCAYCTRQESSQYVQCIEDRSGREETDHIERDDTTLPHDPRYTLVARKLGKHRQAVVRGDTPKSLGRLVADHILLCCAAEDRDKRRDGVGGRELAEDVGNLVAVITGCVSINCA